MHLLYYIIIMKKFRVECHNLYWFNDTYEVEAEDESEIDDAYLEEFGEIVDSTIDCLDQINEISSIEEIEDEE